jgi:prephenate dehydrogenase
VLDETAATFEQLSAGAEVLVLAAPLDATLEQLAVLRRVPSAAELILDVASVKEPVARAGAHVERFVATHPIAGSERSGFAAARADLFDGKMWAYDCNTAEPLRGLVRAFIADMGARPLPIDPAEHDRIVAYTSHLPQLLSVLLGAELASRLDRPDVSALCGTGIASMLRLSRSSWDVWEPILRSNAAPIAQEVRAFAAILMDAATTLESGHPHALEPTFKAASTAAARIQSNPETAP